MLEWSLFILGGRWYLYSDISVLWRESPRISDLGENVHCLLSIAQHYEEHLTQVSVKPSSFFLIKASWSKFFMKDFFFSFALSSTLLLSSLLTRAYAMLTSFITAGLSREHDYNSYWKLKIMVYKVLNMDIFLTKTHWFTSGAFINPPGAVWHTFFYFYGWMHFIGLLLDFWITHSLPL